MADSELIVQKYTSTMNAKKVQEKAFKCGFWSCVSSYSRIRDLHLHQEKLHGAKQVTEGAHRCPTCQRGYSDKKQMNRHIKNAHRLLKSEYTVGYKCHICGDAGATVTDPKNHNISGHTLVKVYTCVMQPPTQIWGYSDKICDFSHSNLTVLRTHLKSHLAEQVLKPDRIPKAKYSCNQCSYMSRRARDLERHKDRRCLKVQEYKARWDKQCLRPSYDCELCGGTYKGERSLRKHLKERCLSLKYKKTPADRKLFIKKIVKTAVDAKKQFLGLDKTSRKKQV